MLILVRILPQPNRSSYELEVRLHATLGITISQCTRGSATFAIGLAQRRSASGAIATRRLCFESTGLLELQCLVGCSGRNKIQNSPHECRQSGMQVIRPYQPLVCPPEGVPAKRLSIPASVCISGPVGRAPIGAISAIQRGTRIWVRTGGADRRSMRYKFPGAMLYFHTVGEDVAGQ